MDTEDSKPCPQYPAISSNSEPDLKIILLCTCTLSFWVGSILQVLQNQLFIPHQSNVISPLNPLWLNHSNNLIFDKNKKQRNSKFLNFGSSPHSPCSSSNEWDQVSYLHKTASKVIILFVWKLIKRWTVGWVLSNKLWRTERSAKCGPAPTSNGYRHKEHVTNDCDYSGIPKWCLHNTSL